MKNLLISAGVAAILAGCATAPPRSDQLERARAEVQTLSQDPLSQQAAAKDLEAARINLQAAQTALEQKQPLTQVDHYAYLAQRHAEAGQARVQEAHARQEVASAEERRNKVLLQAREQETAAARDQAAIAKAKLAATQAELADLKAKQTDRGLVVTIGDVLFDTGQSSLKPGADLTLDRLATVMKENSQAKIVIEGHTDSIGSDSYNDALSERRADAVQSALIRRGVPSDAVRAIGRGKHFPVASNDTAAGRQQNRRVEIVFSDASGRFAQSEMNEPARR